MAFEDFDISEELDGGVCKLHLKGRITSMNANVLQHKLSEIENSGVKKVVLNMMQVAFLSSAGIRVILMFYKKAKESGGSFHIDSPSENVVNVLGMTALDDMLLSD